MESEEEGLLEHKMRNEDENLDAEDTVISDTCTHDGDESAQDSESEAGQNQHFNACVGNNDGTSGDDEEEYVEPREFQLHRAACEGDVERLETLLAVSTDDIDDRCENRRTYLMQAVIIDRLACVDVLVRFGCDLNCEDINQKDAMMLAAEYNRVGCLRYLYKSGSYLLKSPSKKMDVLKAAVQAESFEALKLLLELFPDVSPCLEEEIKVLHPTCLYMQKYFQMAPVVNIYTHEYPTTSKYHMLPTHLRGEISTHKIGFFTIGLHGNLQISH